MEAHATVVAEARGGRTTFPVLRSAPPLTLRATPGGLHLVGSAAGPLGGDRLRLDVHVGPGAAVTIGSVAAALVQPGARGGGSRLEVHADVGRGASLRWLPEPTVAVAGCDHQAVAHLDLAADATVCWREELVLGRHGEPGGSVLQRLVVDRAGRPLVRNDLAVGSRWPGSLGPAGVDGARAVGALLVVGPHGPSDGHALADGPAGPGAGTSAGEVRSAALGVGPGAVLHTAVATGAAALRRALDEALGDTASPVHRGAPHGAQPVVPRPGSEGGSRGARR